MSTLRYSALLCCTVIFATVKAEKVEIAKIQDRVFQLIVNGKPFEAKGVGGTNNLDILKDLGGNCIRTWGVDDLEKEINGRPLLDYAHSLGLKVALGIWIEHERHGFDYKNPQNIKTQREHVRETVRKYRNHPALLAWGLGNEMEGPASDGSNVYIWEELNELAKIVKEEDTDHPVMTVIAGIGGKKVENIKAYYPEIDILGVNAYGGASSVSAGLRAAGWNKPYMLTEFGPLGHWEVAKAPWGAPIEPHSQNKAADYYVTHQRTMKEAEGICLGTFAFYWDFKQEMTETWYGMFLKTGERLGSVDAMSYAWTGSFPKNRAPKMRALESPAYLNYVKPGSRHLATVKVIDPDGDPLEYRWIVIAETSDSKIGGDPEKAPTEYPELTKDCSGPEITFTAPNQSGPYRLFVFVKDTANGAATANFPFYVR